MYLKKTYKQPLCVSVFKNGTSSTTKETFTNVMIKLINDLERNKINSFK